MKNFLVLFFSFVLLFAGSVLMAQQPDTTFTIDSFANEVTAVIQLLTGKDLTYTILVTTAIIGAVIHTVIWTLKGIKNSPTSPFFWAWSYWKKDNTLTKVTTFCTIILSSKLFIGLLAKLPAGWISYLVIGLVGLLVGFFIDFIASRLKKIIPKEEILPTPKATL